ncbi:hypothetical protein [Haliscomenobacter sp.]|uniref:hypothetical protein n=1 Tax=Haliscomenobacter sp. TaxID=2717303 RepID=UPI003593F583
MKSTICSFYFLLLYCCNSIDLEPKAVPGAWLGLTTRVAKDSTVVTAVEYDSPAWKAGLRRRNFILEVYNEPAKSFSFANMIPDQFPGDEIELMVLQGQEKRYLRFVMGKKMERSFKMSPLANPGKLQRAIYEGWVNGKVSP